MVSVVIDTIGYNASERHQIDSAIRHICMMQKTDVDYVTSHKHSIIRYNNGDIKEEVLAIFKQDKDDDITSGGG